MHQVPLLKVLCLRASEKAQTTPLWSSCGQTRVSAKGNSQRSWEPTRYREHSDSKRTAFLLEVSQLAHPTAHMRSGFDNPHRTTRRHPYQVGHKILRADPSQDRASWRLQVCLGRKPRQPQHHVRRSIHRIRKRCIGMGHSFPVVHVQVERPRSLRRYNKGPARLHRHRRLRTLTPGFGGKTVLLLGICAGAVDSLFPFSYCPS